MIQGDRLLWEAIEKKILREDVEKKNFLWEDDGGYWRTLKKKNFVGGR